MPNTHSVRILGSASLWNLPQLTLEGGESSSFTVDFITPLLSMADHHFFVVTQGFLNSHPTLFRGADLLLRCLLYTHGRCLGWRDRHSRHSRDSRDSWWWGRWQHRCAGEDVERHGIRWWESCETPGRSPIWGWDADVWAGGLESGKKKLGSSNCWILAKYACWAMQMAKEFWMGTSWEQQHL